MQISSYAAQVTAALLLAAPSIQAANLPSVTVPTFSMAFTQYDSDINYDPAPDAAISLVSTSSVATVISLDSFEQTLQADSSGYALGRAEVYSKMHFKAADGYRITGISFSASAYGVLERPDIGTGWTTVHYGESTNGTHAGGQIYAPGSVQNVTLFDQRQITDPVSLGGTFTNTSEADEFEFLFYVALGAISDATYIYYPGEFPGNERKVWGNAELHYVDPVLTVHTAPLTAVPEPGQWAMLLGGMALMFGALRFTRK